MGEISVSGEGLGILICCKLLPIDDWMSFVCWHSLQKHLPDAKIVMMCEQGDTQWDLFRWIYRARLKLLWRTAPNKEQLLAEQFPEAEKAIAITPYVMAIREYGSLLGPVPVKSDQIATLVDCEEGCGRFITSKWINRVNIPITRANKAFRSEDMTANEVRVLDLWSSCNWLYATMQ